MIGMISLILLWLSGSTPQLTPQQPTYAFRSTSQMMPSTPTYSREYAAPFASSAPSRPRRALDEDDLEERLDRLPNTPDGQIGDISWVMVLIFSIGYVVYVATRKRSQF